MLLILLALTLQGAVPFALPPGDAPLPAAATPVRAGTSARAAARVATLPAVGARPVLDPAGCSGAVRVARTAYLMGAPLRIEVAGADRGCAGAAAEAALRAVEHMEAMLSSWRSDSELGGVNASPPGSPVALSPELAALLAEAAAWRDATSGAFDPAVGALIDAWDLRGAGRVPVAASLAAARAAATFPACLELSAGTATRLLESCWVDSGGFGKGAALRAARAALGSHGVTAAVLDFGGQVEVLGPSVPIAVAHPAQRDLPYRTLLAGDVSLATSSQSERFVEAAGVRYGHVLDPRTGSPVPAWGSVTVLAGDPLIADVLSTALFVMGPDSALAWARARTDVGVLVLQLSAGDVIAAWNPALEPFLQSRTTTTNTSKETF